MAVSLVRKVSGSSEQIRYLLWYASGRLPFTHVSIGAGPARNFEKILETVF
jgi:hypothetical protein